MKIMKIASTISGIILALYAVFLLIWLWGDSVSWETFVKTSITAGVVIVATMGLALLYREYIEEKSMKDKGFID
jgi:hypothetical protein